MIRYLLFDIDDTLLNFRDNAEVAIRRALADEGVSFTSEQMAVYHRINDALWAQVSAGALSREGLYAIRFQRVLDALAIPADGRAVEARFRHHQNHIAVPEEGAAPTLEALSARYVLATASNAPQRQQEVRLERSGLARYFTHILTSEGLGYDKPSRRFFDACLHALGDPPRNEVMMLGDSLTADVGGAQNAGLAACWVNLKGAPADPPTESAVPRIDAVPTVHALPELCALLLSPPVD